MRVLFGLGNPGSEYEGTRHNIGFSVLDAIATTLELTFSAGKGEYSIALSRTSPEFLLVKPMTCMNNSGFAVKEVLEKFAIDRNDSLTIVDDFELPLGTIRLRKRGSAGTHNGLASIVWSLETEEFPRLRCGIGGDAKPADKRKTADFVLSPFEMREREIVAMMVAKASTCAILFGKVSLQKTIEFLSQ